MQDESHFSYAGENLPVGTRAAQYIQNRNRSDAHCDSSWVWPMCCGKKSPISLSDPQQLLKRQYTSFVLKAASTNCSPKWRSTTSMLFWLIHRSDRPWVSKRSIICLGNPGLGFFGSAKLAETYGPDFPASLNGAPMLLPTMRTSLRRHLDQWFQANGDSTTRHRGI